MKPRLSDFRILTFDCYGTLIDWETGIWDALQPLLMRSGAVEVTRDIALRAFAEVEGRNEAANPGLRYPELLERVHRDLAGTFAMETTPALDAAFGASVGQWPAFPDTADALRRLARRYRLVILSNVHRDGIAASQRKLGARFDAVWTAEDIGDYKPSLTNFRFLLERLQSDFGFGPEDVLHTAQSLHHDHVPAKRLGLRNAWIDRQRLSEGGSWGATAPLETLPETDFVFPTLAAMAEAVDADQRPGATGGGSSSQKSSGAGFGTG